MIRLNLERLDERDLMSAGTLATLAPAPHGAAPAEIVVAFTPPIGSNKGSFVGSTTVQGICAVWHD